MNTSAQTTWPEPRSSLITVAHVVYALHTVGLAIGAWTSASVVGSFLFGWPSIIAVILNYAMRSGARGTWLQSHFRWQLRTFWFAALWALLVALISLPLALILVGFATWFAGIFLLGIWAAIRIVQGWLRLKDSKPVEA